jgi:hypothetical protein
MKMSLRKTLHGVIETQPSAVYLGQDRNDVPVCLQAVLIDKGDAYIIDQVSHRFETKGPGLNERLTDEVIAFNVAETIQQMGLIGFYEIQNMVGHARLDKIVYLRLTQDKIRLSLEDPMPSGQVYA